MAPRRLSAVDPSQHFVPAVRVLTCRNDPGRSRDPVGFLLLLLYVLQELYDSQQYIHYHWGAGGGQLLQVGAGQGLQGVPAIEETLS